MSDSKKYEQILDFFKSINLQKKIDKLSVKYKNKRIILYGTGLSFDVIVENFNISELNVVAVSDKKFQEDCPLEYKGFIAISPLSIHENKPDIVLVTMLEHYLIKDYFEKEFFKKGHYFKYQGIIEPSFWELFIALIFNSFC